MCGSLFLIPSLGFFFLCLFILFNSNVLVCVLFITPQKPAYFLRRDGKGVDLHGRGGGEELGGLGGGTVVRIHCVETKNYFQ